MLPFGLPNPEIPLQISQLNENHQHQDAVKIEGKGGAARGNYSHIKFKLKFSQKPVGPISRRNISLLHIPPVHPFWGEKINIEEVLFGFHVHIIVPSSIITRNSKLPPSGPLSSENPYQPPTQKLYL